MRLYHPLWALLSIVFLLSCTRAPGTEILDPVDNTSDAQMSLKVQVPVRTSGAGGTTVATDDENRIIALNVLAFRVDANDNTKEYYDYKTTAIYVQDGNASNIKHYKATVLKRDYDQRFVLIANAYDKVQAIDDSFADMDKETLLETLEFEKTGAWHSAQESDFTFLPMWGESTQVNISDINDLNQTIKLVRMVSRIEVDIEEDRKDEEDFVFSSIHLYNFHTNGRVTPDRSAASWSEADYKALGVSLPSTAVRVKGPNAHSAVTGTDGSKYLPYVYTFESPAAAYPQASDATCVVIGGIYGKDTDPTYYRVDFFDRNEQDEILGYMSLLRNHTYLLNILSVKGSGHGTPDEAFEAKSENMTVKIIDWNDGDLTNVVFDGSYMLGVSQDLFTLPKNKSENKLVVVTDYPQGWTPTLVPEDTDWLTIDSWQFPGAGIKGDLIFTVKENTTGKEREAWIVITAGRLSLRVKVEQGIGETQTLVITDEYGKEITELFFHCHYEDSEVPMQEYNVTWTPATETAFVSSQTVGSFAFDPGMIDNPLTTVSLSGGLQNYRIKPRPVTATELDLNKGGDPFLEKVSRVIYTVGDGVDMIARSITLRQLHYELLTDIQPEYSLDGSQYYFTVRSNGPWTAELADNAKDAVTLNTTSGTADTGAGIPFYFTLANDQNGNIGSKEAEVTFTITCPKTGAQFIRKVIINCAGLQQAHDEPAANSYMLIPGGDGVKIPLSQANADGTTRLPANASIKAKVIWVDNPSLKSVVSRYTIEGQGSGGKLVVYPGDTPGNALIGIEYNNEIVWSYHIWVVDYEPDNGGTTYLLSGTSWTFMDRNLGATTDQAGSPDFYGLFYQWGRKDPFPGSSKVGTTGSRPIYDAEGAPLIPEIFHAPTHSSTSTNNINYSVAHPEQFLYSTTNDCDWYSNQTQAYNNDLWTDTGAKSVYDPCPAGWRVPNGSPFESNWNGITYRSSGEYVEYSGLGNWPLVGQRLGTNGSYSEDIRAYYWVSHTISPTQARTFNLQQSNNPERSGTRHRAYGEPVRCVKD